jgi:hypothetical protein
MLVPEGRKGEGWEAFRSELRSMVNHMKTNKGGDKCPSKKDHGSMPIEPPLTVKVPEPPRRRSFADTMMSSSNVSELLTLTTRPNTKLLKRAELVAVQKSRVPVTFDVLQSDTPKG